MIKLTYDITIYAQENNKYNRFSLGSTGIKPLFVIGLNPSTADNEKSDRTISKVMGFAEKNGNDSFIMLNLYAQRATNPDELDSILNEQIHKRNIEIICSTLSMVLTPSILAAWGDTITKRKYLIKCLSEINDITKKQSPNWLRIGELTLRKHPRHPSRAGYDKLNRFDIDSYLKLMA